MATAITAGDFYTEIMLQIAYAKYTKHWCKKHRFDPAAVAEAFLDGDTYKGKMYKSYGEFEQGMFKDRRLMRKVLKNKTLYSAYRKLEA